jgi:DNA-binding transcriptional LysR family regulator
MEWHQLEYFCTVAQLQHFTHAAEKLSISQPALSRSIAKLEKELGISLFERQGKKVSLNRFGQIFFKHVERSMQEIIDAKQEIQDIINPDYGVVSFAFLHSQGTHNVPELIGRFLAKYPKIQFKLYQNPAHILLEQLMSDEIDLCLTSPVFSEKKIEWTPLYTEELFAVVSKDHRFSNRKSIELVEIAEEPIITFKNEYSLRSITDQLFEEAGLTPKIAFEGEELMTLAGLAETKLGVAIIPQLLGRNNSQLSFIPISEPKCFRTIGLAWTKARYASPVAKIFRNFVLNFFALKKESL